MLIFCSSRKGCESTARHVSRFLKNPKASIKNEGNEIVDISSAIDALRKCPVGLDPVLEETLPFGVAYHHAGLTVFFLVSFLVLSPIDSKVWSLRCFLSCSSCLITLQHFTLSSLLKI